MSELRAWIGSALQAIGSGIVVRVREEPVITVGLVRAFITMLVGFGLGWSGEQVALLVAFIEAVTVYISRQQVTPVVRVDA